MMNIYSKTLTSAAAAGIALLTLSVMPSFAQTKPQMPATPTESNPMQQMNPEQMRQHDEQMMGQMQQMMGQMQQMMGQMQQMREQCNSMMGDGTGMMRNHNQQPGQMMNSPTPKE
ncbi:hypothetical protein [Lyngbya aestuarii]|uniref:hypothetical protein n=1 Tax=Lyngbya aestuarii TaxID=118322 RepID=UPI00403DE3CA